MLELEPHHSHHHHHQDHTPGLELYGSRCNPYTFPITRIPRPLFLDNLHSRQGYNAFSRERFQAWAQASMQQSGDKAIQPHASRPTERLKKPFVATAAFPADIPRLVEIEFAAFQDELVNHHLSYRDGSNPDHTNRTVDFYKSCMKHMRTNSLPAGSANHGANFVRRDSKVDLATPDSSTEGYRFRKVLDPQTGEIIAFAKSEITTLTDEDHASPLDVGHESEPEMNRAWFALNEKLHRSYCGFRKHLYFGMLATHPSYQHRGAATALMSELIAEADALGLEIYCEATRTGRPMYEKYGFVPVETLKFDPAAFGRHDLGVEVQTVMIRGVGGVWDGKRI